VAPWFLGRIGFSSQAKACLTLVILAPLLTELVSGNTPAQAFLDPRVALFLAFAYSLPLLLIRELSLRRRLSIAGVFLLGLAYGIVNEGLLAQTLLRYEHVPIDRFDRHVFVAGFNFSWAAVIVPWHAFFAVLFPLALVSAWFPSCAQQTWLSGRAFKFLAAIVVALMAFLSVVGKPHPQMLGCFLAIAALSSAAFLFRDRRSPLAERSFQRFHPFLFGLLGYPVYFLGSIILAARRAPALLFFAFVVLVLFALGKISRSYRFLIQPASPYLALGAYLSVSLFHLLAGVARRSPEDIVTAAILAAAFLFLGFAGKNGIPATAACGET